MSWGGGAVGRMPRALARAPAIAIALLALAIAAAPAHAASTRAEYVAQVDPICATAQLQEAAAAGPVIAAQQRIKRHGKSRRRARKLNRALRYSLIQHLAIERSANAQIATVPPASEDTSLIQVWLRTRGELLDAEEHLFLNGFESKESLKSAIRFITEFFDLVGREYEAGDLIRDFGFQYCGKETSTGGFGSL